MQSPSVCWIYNAKTQYREFKTNISRKGLARPQFQFLHSCVCERFMYSHDWSAYSAAGKYMDRSWEYINRSQTHECRNCDWVRAISFLGIHKWDFRCSIGPVIWNLLADRKLVRFLNLQLKKRLKLYSVRQFLLNPVTELNLEWFVAWGRMHYCYFR
jgi:hypothetical protein